MPKRKFEDLVDGSEFKFWGIVISRLAWGYTRSEVATKFSCSEAYVTQVVNKFEEDEGYVDKRQYNGPDKKFKEEVKKTIVNEYKRKPTSTSNSIKEKCAESGIDVSDRTIRRIRCEIGFVPIKPSVLPMLDQDNKKSRLKYCKDHCEDKFSNVCFSDESIFQLCANKQVVWYRKTEDIKPVTSTPKQNRKIMIWGGISRRGKTPLFIYRLDKKETVRSETYVECLEESLIEVMDRKYGKGLWRFLQDGTRPHTAHNTMHYLEENDVRVLEHPSYSPDLNPIEQVWAWMKHDVTSATYESVDDLVEAVLAKWEKLTIELQNKIIDHHCKIVGEVLEAKGAYI